MNEHATEHLTSRQIDEAVAVKVMGWTWPADRCRVCGWSLMSRDGCTVDNCSLRPAPKVPRAEDYPNYSTNIKAAWEVVEKLPHRVTVIKTRIEDKERYRVELRGEGMEFVLCEVAPTAQMAICLAALKAVGR